MRGSFSFNINIINKPFNTGNFITDKTARITFIDNQNNIQQITNYGIISTTEIYNRIFHNESLNFDNCYVNNFSLSEYRKRFSLDKTKVVILKNFSANRSFFEADEIIDFSTASFIGEILSFKNTFFGNGHLSFYKSNYKLTNIVDFSHAFFGKGRTNFQYSDFHKCDINFTEVINIGDLSFVNTNFGTGRVLFKNVSFGDGKIEFHFSKFENSQIIFSKSIFEGEKVDFRRIEFGNGKLDFRRVNFGDAQVMFDESEVGLGKTSFKNSRFGKGKLSFYLTNFKAPLSFEKVEFGTGKVSLFKAKLNHLSFKSCHLDNYLDLRVESCDVIDLSDAVVRDIIDFQNDFSSVKIKELNLFGLRNLGKLILDWKLNNVEELIENQNSTIYQKAEQYRLLKENFHSYGRYEDEDEAYVRFKRYELKLNYIDNKKKGGLYSLYAFANKWFQKILFDYMGKYATQPFRVLVSMFIIYVFFSFIYFAMMLLELGDLKPAFANPEQMPDLTLAFYHSAITFLTIGYGDYAPWGIIRILSSFEGFVGLFMMSYFTVAFVRKILR